MAEPEFLETSEAAERLGVKPATLYAYVSRGLLRRHRDPDSRRSLFRPEEVDALRRQSHPSRPSGDEVTFESAITVLGADRPFYRGVDALGLAGSARYEDVAEWLWSGIHTATEGGWPSLDGAVTAWVNSARPAWEFFMKASRLLRPSAHEAVALAAITTAVNRRFILSP